MRYDVWVDYFKAIGNSLLASSAIYASLTQTFEKVVSSINSVISLFKGHRNWAKNLRFLDKIQVNFLNFFYLFKMTHSNKFSWHVWCNQ